MLGVMQVSLKQILQWVLPLIVLALIVWLCTFKIADTDFWWHIKAGQLMRETGGIIHTDPFAYTREGQPYLAIHEWFAQVILSLVFDFGGALGITILRIVLVSGTFALLLFIDPKRAWVNAILIGFSAASIRHAIADRPQLFTFFLFTLVLFCCIQFLQIESYRRRKRILFFFPVILLAWSNLHGAASLLGVALLGWLFLQKLADEVFHPKKRSLVHVQELWWMLGMLALSLVALLLTPSGVGNITYLLSLQSDRTTEYISEWQRAPFTIYFSRTWFLWLFAIVSVAIGRKNLLFSIFTLIGIGYLSCTAVRHEPLIIFVTLGIIFHQLRYTDVWHRFLHTVTSQRIIFLFLLLGLLSSLILHIYRTGFDAKRQFQLFGIGTFEIGKYAYDFIEQQGLQGPMFNNYDIGGYLLFRGAPERKVFLDGRNVDYGFAYMQKAVEADRDPRLWQELTAQYGFTYAVIEYGSQSFRDPIPYVDHLDRDPAWALVYLDDWVAVYARRIPENAALIERFAYTAITPKTLTRHTISEELRLGELIRMQDELQRIAENNPEGIQAFLYAARLGIVLQKYDQAKAALEAALIRQPRHYQVFEIFARLAMEQGDWKSANIFLDQALHFLGFSNRNIDQNFIEMVHKKAVTAE